MLLIFAHDKMPLSVGWALLGMRKYLSDPFLRVRCAYEVNMLVTSLQNHFCVSAVRVRRTPW